MRDQIKTLLPWILTIFAALMGMAAFFLIFAQSVVYDVFIFGENTFKGLNVALGYTFNKTNVIFHASAGMILSYVFPLLAASVAVIGKDSLIARIVATALFFVGGALSFAATSLVNPGDVLTGGTATLGLGSIFSGIMAILGGIAEGVTCLPFFPKMEEDEEEAANA
ncbi:MAG: hypothetical protein IJU10_01095 [Clostridia bacterium]|nr:hypothetical protein [Clostridia bacterium]